MSNYSNARLPKYVPGCVLQAYGKLVPAVYALPTNYRNSISVPLTNFAAGVNTNSLNVPALGYYENDQFNLGSPVAASQLVGQLSEQLREFATVTQDPNNAANVLITSMLFGNFPFSFTINGTTLTSAAVTPQPAIRPGRILVARGNSNPFNGDQQIFHKVDYPDLATDNPETLGKIYLSGQGETFSTSRVLTNNANFGVQEVLPGGCVEAYYQTQGMVVSPITAIDGNDALFVETKAAGVELAGRLTSVATPTTIALPNASLNVLHAAAANGLAIVALG